MVASKMAAFDLSHFTDFEQVKIVNDHFTDFEHVKIANGYYTVFEQVKNFSSHFLLTLSNNYKFMIFLVITFLYYIKKKSKTFW